MSCGVVRCVACRSVSDSIFLQKNALLADEWSAAKHAAWKIAVMSLVDGSDSQVYKRKLKDVEKAAIKKALKRRKTVPCASKRMSERMCSEPSAGGKYC